MFTFNNLLTRRMVTVAAALAILVSWQGKASAQLPPETQAQGDRVSLPLVYPEDLSQYGSIYVLTIDQPLLAVDPGNGVLHGWESNTSTSFALVVDEAHHRTANVTSIKFRFASAGGAAQAVAALDRPNFKAVSLVDQAVTRKLNALGIMAKTTILEPDSYTISYNLIMAAGGEVVEIYVTVAIDGAAFGQQLTSIIAQKYGDIQLKGTTGYSDPAVKTTHNQPALGVSPQIWSTRASANRWGNWEDGGGRHTAAVWDSDISASSPQFEYSDTKAWSPFYGYIYQWSWHSHAPSMLGVPDTTWLVICTSVPYVPDAERYNISNYSAMVLYP